MNSSKVFISYSRQDSKFSLKLANDLRLNGVTVWIDQVDIPKGSRWDSEIEKALSDAETLLVILSEKSIASQNILDEINHALDQNKRIIPVLIEKCSIPFRIRRFQHINFINDHDYAFADLLKTLNLESPEEKKTKGGPTKKKIFIVAVSVIIFTAILSLFLFNNWFIKGAKWVKSRNGLIPENAFKAGYESDSSPLYIARAKYSDGLHVGKIGTNSTVALIPYGGLEVQRKDFEILLNSANLKWVPKTDTLPKKALRGGHESDGTPLYVIRARHEGGLHPGKFNPREKHAVIPYGGLEERVYDFEILTVKN